MKEYPLPNKIIWFIVHNVGAWPTLGCLAVGAFVILSSICREKIKDILGPFLKWLDGFVNKD